jgi:hypothetical protein
VARVSVCVRGVKDGSKKRHTSRPNRIVTLCSLSYLKLQIHVCVGIIWELNSFVMQQRLSAVGPNCCIYIYI